MGIFEAIAVSIRPTEQPKSHAIRAWRQPANKILSALAPEVSLPDRFSAALHFPCSASILLPG